MSVDVWERLRSEPGMRSLTKGLIAGIAMLAWAEPTAANKSVIAGIGGGQGVDQATLSVRADRIEDEWTATVGAATARQWRAYLDQLPPAIADAFMAWWQARGWAEWQHRAWQNRSANANDARSRTDRLAAIERRINADRAGGRRAFDAEVVRCYSDGGVDRLVYCGPSILDHDPIPARPSAEPQDPLPLISRVWQHRWTLEDVLQSAAAMIATWQRNKLSVFGFGDEAQELELLCVIGYGVALLVLRIIDLECSARIPHAEDLQMVYRWVPG